MSYPFTIPSEDIGTTQPQESFEPLQLGVLGMREVNFEAEGLAHYGMLPEFLHTVGKLDQNGSSIDNLFSSAHAFVKMWERVEEAQNRVV